MQSQQRSIGLQLCHYNNTAFVKVATWCCHQQPLSLSNAQTFPLDSPLNCTENARRLKTIIQKHRPVVCIPHDAINLTRKVLASTLNHRELTHYIRQNITNYKDFYISHKIMNTPQKRNALFILTIEKNYLNTIVNMIKRCYKKPFRIESEPLTLTMLCPSNAQTELVLIQQVRHYLLCVIQNRALIDFSSISVGTDSIKVINEQIKTYQTLYTPIQQLWCAIKPKAAEILGARLSLPITTITHSETIIHRCLAEGELHAQH